MIKSANYLTFFLEFIAKQNQFIMTLFNLKKMNCWNLFWLLLLLVGFTTDTYAQTKPLKGTKLFGSMRARHIGPAVMSGRISDIEGVNNDPKTFYVGAAGGGVWKTTNGGITFDPIFDKYSQSIGKITVDQKKPTTIWVGTGEPWVRNSVSVGTGLYKSDDGGKNWQLMGFKNSEHISEIIIHPKNSNIVYVGVLGHLWDAHQTRGVYKTEDGGKTWQQLLYVDENTGLADMAMDASNPAVIYASMWQFRRSPDFFKSGGKGSGLYKTTDGGKTWKKIQQGFPKGILGRMAVQPAPSKPSTVYATVESEKRDKNGLYKSTDGGANWKKVNGDFGTIVRPFYFARLVVDPKDENKVYKMGLNLIISKDGGSRFRTVGSGVHSDMHALWINPQNTNNILLGTDGGLYQSFDGGFFFMHLKNLPVSQFYRVSVDNAQPYNVYGGLQDNGSWFGPSRAANGIQNRDWTNVGGGDGFVALRHPTKANIVYCEMQGGKLWRYDLSSGQRKTISPMPQQEDPKYRFNWNTPIVTSIHQPNRLLMGSQFLHRSNDNGESWKKISPDLTTNDPKRQRRASGGLTPDVSAAETNTTIFSIGESSLDENVLWVGTDDGNLQVTMDGGKKWTNVVSNIQGLPKNTWCSTVEPGHFDKNTAYVTFDGHRTGDKKTYVYKTTDGGKTWVSLATTDLKGHAHVVREDLKNRNLLFLGTELGLYASVDGGKNWTRFKNNLPMVSIRDMVIHPTTNDLVMGTHGRGIIILDDISPLRLLTPAIASKKLEFLPTQPIVIRGIGGGQEFPGAAEFVGANPSTAGKIIYYQKKRHIFGSMKIEVFDAKGNLVANLPASKNAGLNIVRWNPRLKPPKTPKAKTFTFAAFQGPLLPEGKYTVKLKKGKDTYETSLEIKADPDSPFTAADRDLYQKTAMRMYNLIEKLAYTSDVVQSIMKQARQKAGKNKRLAKKLNAMHARLSKFNSELVITSGDNYTDSAEERLNEKLAAVYGDISTYNGRPSKDQLQRANVLEKRVEAAYQRMLKIKNQDLKSMNARLVKARAGKITVKTMNEFKKSRK